jgi:hypothetical protein
MQKVDLSSGWFSYEVIHKATGETPVSAAIASGSDKVAVIKKIMMVQEVGWPAAKKLHFGKKGKHRVVRKDDVVWLLKCTPHCWRLYFYIYEPKQWIIYLHAVCKKQDEEEPDDAIKARAVYNEINGGACGITPFEFPSS